MSAASPTRPSRRAAARRKIVVDEEDSSDVENIAVGHPADEEGEGEEFVPAPVGSRTSPRRRTATGQDGPRLKPAGAASARRARNMDTIASSIEPSQIFDLPTDTTIASEVASPTKWSPPKRRSVRDARAARKSRTSRMPMASDASEVQTSLPTPEPSATPEPRLQRGTPLIDITESTLNEQTPRPVPEPLTPSEEGSVSPEILNPATPKIHLEEGEPMEGVEEATDLTQTPKQTDSPSAQLDVREPDGTMDIVIKKRNLGIPLSQEPSVPQERMTITYLTLTNFKSYAGTQVVGPFHASFSSVVGPNGSGKSNVIDSLLFVFGFRASKMRQGKISALIHNSARYPDLKFCEVEVRFEMVMDVPGGGSMVVPDSQLVISRRAFGDNSSKYYIDGKASNFTAVTTLLKARGVDLDHKRFLILQGEVESIAQMKPKAANEHDDGLLEYLEDIIGTSKYKGPIAELMAETDTLDEVVAEKKSRLEHVEKEKNSLEDKKNKALAFIRDENELVMKKSASYQKGLASCNENKDALEEANGELQKQLAQELERHQGAEYGIKALEERYRASEKEHQTMEKENKELSKRVDSLDKAAVKVGEKKKHLDSKTKKLQKALESSRFGMSESGTLAKQAEEDVHRISSEVEELEREMREEDGELGKVRESLKGKTQDLNDQIATKQKQLDPWMAKINDRQSAAAVAQSELDLLRDRENSGIKAMTQMDERVRDLNEQRRSKNALIQDCEQQREAAAAELRSAQTRLDEVSRQFPPVQSKLFSARQKADEARASLSASKSQGEVLAALTRMSESGRIEGFHGRLGNLGAIDAKYDIAISTACPSLDNLVVDTVESAQQCIAHLRRNNLGRANFIALDRLAKRDLAPVQTPENCPRLFDLIRSKHERYLPAFYHVLQNTVVAEDSSQADRVAYGAKRWRVVSLAGKLVDKSGVMSGGGSKVARGAMSSKVAVDVTKEQVAAFEVDRETLEQESIGLQARQSGLQTQIRELEKRIPELETETQKLSLERDSIDRDISDARKHSQELTAGKQPARSDKKRIAELEKTVAALQEETRKLQSETESIETDIKDLQDKIMEIGGVKLRSQKAKVDGLREQIDSLNETLSAAEVALTKSKKQQVKYSKAIQEVSEEIDKVAHEVEKVEDEARSQNQDNSGLRHEAEEANQALEDKKDELKDLKKQLDERTAELNEGRGAVVEIQKMINDNQKLLDSNQRRLDLHVEKKAKLSLYNFSEDGEEGDPEAVPELSPDEIAALDMDEISAAIVRLEERTSQHVELSVLAEYHRRVREYSSRFEDFSTAKGNSVTAHQRLKELKKLRHDGFMTGFTTISARLKEMYQMITMGGNAELELVDSLDPFMEGVSFSVMPPKKSWKNISNLSGGEKTLSSLALVFALHHYKPTPLYVMDEIDAALDFRNVSIVAAYIKERTKNAQFIVISLRNNMFELASRLVGVYKVNHMTKSVTVENRDYIVPRDRQ